MKRNAPKSRRRTDTPAAASAPAKAIRPDPASLELVIYPDPTLKKVAKTVTEFDAWLHAVVERMKDLMVEHKGVGIAAPQVGLSLRIFIASPTAKREDAVAYINPVLSDEEGTEEGEEGCLSLPDIRVKIPRYTSLQIEAVDPAGKSHSAKATDYEARIMQHENDHLDGVLLTDRMSPMAKLANRKKIKELEFDAEKNAKKR